MKNSLNETLSWRCRFASANSNQRILSIFSEIIRSMGMKHVIYAYGSIRRNIGQETILLTTLPAAWQQQYLLMNYQHIDPALMLALTSTLPVNWSNISRRSKRVQDFFNEAMEMGVGRTGITLSVFGPMGEGALVAVTSDLPEEEWSRQSAEVEKNVTYLAHLVHDRVLALSGQAEETDHQSLSLMEKSCLQWIADGLTMKQVGTKLNVSERAVRMYLGTARAKLNAHNTVHAVAILMRKNQLV